MALILSYQLRSNFLSCPLIITLQNVLHLVILHQIEQCILQIKDDEWGIKSGFIQITNAKYFLLPKLSLLTFMHGIHFLWHHTRTKYKPISVWSVGNRSNSNNRQCKIVKYIITKSRRNVKKNRIWLTNASYEIVKVYLCNWYKYLNFKLTLQTPYITSSARVIIILV